MLLFASLLIPSAAHILATAVSLPKMGFRNKHDKTFQPPPLPRFVSPNRSMAPRTETDVHRHPMETVVSEKAEQHYEHDIVWRNVIKISLVHVMAVYGLYQYFFSMWQTHIFGSIPPCSYYFVWPSFKKKSQGYHFFKFNASERAALSNIGCRRTAITVVDVWASVFSHYITVSWSTKRQKANSVG